MKFLDEVDYNGGKIVEQDMKDNALLIITRDYYSGEYILYKAPSDKELLRTRDMNKIRERIEKYK